MPKPNNKEELLKDIHTEWEALDKFLASLTPEQMTQPGVIGDWSPKDVLAHLAEWQQMCMGWFNSGFGGETPHLPAEGFKWSQMPALNRKIFAEYQGLSLEKVNKFFRASHTQILEIIQSLSNDEIFKTGNFDWTKKNALSSYLIPCTSSHYRWARTEMRKNLKPRRKG